MAQPRSALGQFFVDNAGMENKELQELVAKTFPGLNLSKMNFYGYRARAREALKREGKKKPKPKPKPNGESVPAPREASDPFATPDAKQLTALIMRVGLNTAEAVMARLKHIEERQR